MINVFVSPALGKIIQAFNTAENNHCGVAIALTDTSAVRAVLDGVVTYAGLTPTGGLIIIQHENGILSSYQSGSKLLKKYANRVIAGELIAQGGFRTTELDTQHLHFDLWYNRSMVAPTEHINFATTN